MRALFLFIFQGIQKLPLIINQQLADFAMEREESLTETMSAETGTYRWMAPKFYPGMGKKHYHKVVAYSIVIILWELIHKLPFQGMSNLQTANASAFKIFILSQNGWAGYVC
ncbi:putative dual-specificity kinase [Helianthus anomalus]